MLIYTGVGEFDKATQSRQLMRQRGLTKIPGETTVEVNNKVFTFYVNDVSHPDLHKIKAKWAELQAKLHMQYKPDISWVLKDISEADKILSLCHHSERLALCYALINSKPGEAIYMTKNLRVSCVVCTLLLQCCWVWCSVVAGLVELLLL